MPQIRFKSVALIGAATLVLGCSSSVYPTPGRSLSVTTTAAEYTPGAVATLTATNNAETALQFVLRDIILQRKDADHWTDLPHDEIPPLLILYDLAPGMSKQFAEPIIPVDAKPGTYRFRLLTRESNGTGSFFNDSELLSNEWQLVAPGT